MYVEYIICVADRRKATIAHKIIIVTQICCNNFCKHCERQYIFVTSKSHDICEFCIFNPLVYCKLFYQISATLYRDTKWSLCSGEKVQLAHRHKTIPL